LIVNFLESEAKLSASGQAMMASRSYSGYGQRVLEQVAGVHLVTYFGLREVMIDLLKNGYDPNSKDSYGQTPLLWATEYGHEAMVKLLPEKDAELESKDWQGLTLLWWAAENGHETVVKLLLEWGAQLDSKSSSGQTPLLRAAEYGHEAVVRLLFEKGAELDYEAWSPVLP
jgi:ankyrin repeat protein